MRSDLARSLVRWAASGCGVVLGVALVAPSPADAQDLQADLAEAQSAIADAKVDVSVGSAALAEAVKTRKPIADDAATAVAEAEQAAAEVEAIEQAVAEERAAAAEEIAAAQAAHEQASDDHDTKVSRGVGAGIALLLLALLPLLWTAFRSSAVSQRLAAEDDERAYKVVGALTLLGLLAGGGLAAAGTGAPAGIGAFLGLTSVGLATAFFLARRELLEGGVSVEQSSDKGVPGGQRRVVLGVILVLGLLLLAIPLASEAPQEPDLPSEVIELAALAEQDVVGTAPEELQDALAALEPLELRAERAQTKADRADRAVEKAEDRLAGARGHLGEAKKHVQLISNRIETAELRAQAHAERAARQAERQAEREARLEEPEDAGGGGGGGCEPGYDPCVPTYPPDLDCGDLDGPYAVTGSDPHGLDADGDGVGCES